MLMSLFSSAVKSEEVQPPTAVCEDKTNPWGTQAGGVLAVSN